MNSVQLKLTIAGVILASAIGYLAYAGMQKGWVYYMEVGQFVSDPAYHAQRVRLHGTVAEQGFSASSAGLAARFDLVGDGKSLPVVYRGTIPDMFQVGRNVVVEGTLASDGTFEADVLMTKCASKYEPSSPHAENRS